MKKKYISILVILIISILFTGCGKEDITGQESMLEEENIQNESSSSEEYQKVVQLIDEGNYKEGKEILEKLIKEYETNGKYELAYGNILLKEKDYENAYIHFHNAIEKNPNIKEAYNNAAGVKMLSKEYDKAMEILDAGLKISPDDYDMKFKKAQLLFVDEKFKESITLMDELKEMDQYYEAYRFIGLSYLNLEQKDKVLENLELYLKKAPDEVPVKEKIQEIVDSLK